MILSRAVVENLQFSDLFEIRLQHCLPPRAGLKPARVTGGLHFSKCAKDISRYASRVSALWLACREAYIFDPFPIHRQAGTLALKLTLI